MLDGVKNILQSATKEPSIKRFVITSSSIAALTPQPGKEINIDCVVKRGLATTVTRLTEGLSRTVVYTRKLQALLT